MYQINASFMNNDVKNIKPVQVDLEDKPMFETDVYNPLDEDAPSGLCRMELTSVTGAGVVKVVGTIGKFAFKAAGGWIGVALIAGCVAYDCLVEDKNLKDAIIDNILPW